MRIVIYLPSSAELQSHPGEGEPPTRIVTEDDEHMHQAAFVLADRGDQELQQQRFALAISFYREAIREYRKVSPATCPQCDGTEDFWPHIWEGKAEATELMMRQPGQVISYPLVSTSLSPISSKRQ